MLASKKITGSGNLVAQGGNGAKVSANTYSGPGGGGIVLSYFHTSKTWTGKATVAPGTTTTEPASAGGTGSHVVRRKFTGALYP